jgi:hypothetical protein
MEGNTQIGEINKRNKTELLEQLDLSYITE